MRRHVIAGLCFMVGIFGMSACANPDDSAASKQAAAGSEDIVAAVTKDDTIAASLPADIKKKGGFTVSINLDVEPVKFRDGSGNIAGLNPDLLRAAAKVLGTEVKFQEGTFDSLVPGLESKRFDVIASVGDYVERQKQIDFIDYLQTGTAILASESLPQNEVTTDGLCGLRIGYARGTSQQTLLEAADKKCLAAGKPAIKSNGYGDGGAGILSVQSGQADGFWGDSPAMRYNVKEHPDLYKIILEERKSVYGIGINKDNQALRDALRAALLKLVADGKYEALLKQWGQEGFGIPTMNINSTNKLG
jgi:polar amino acid transport system substrate-binding protein